MPEIARAIIDSLFPRGSIWSIEQDGDLDKMLDGIGINYDYVLGQIECLGCLRDPYRTPILSDLEREYGLVSDDRLSDETRRMQLATVIYQTENTGSSDNLEDALQAAGFNVQVHENSPAVDPDLFLNSIPFMVADGDNAYAGFVPSGGGSSTAIAGKTGGDLLVNGNIFEQRPEWTTVANSAWAGNTEGFAGSFDSYVQDKVFYPIPNDPDSWPFFFFVGGNATRNAQGELTAIDTADVELARKAEFERLILRYKPLHSWAGLIINYT